jgi:Family of unknown function (DUF5681)
MSNDETTKDTALQPTNNVSIGYGKPPEQTKFKKKGQSGNPYGRPKGSRNLKTLINRELNTTITIEQAGKKRKIRRKDALVKSLVHDALKGRDRPREKVFDYVDRAETLDDAGPTQSELAERDAQILERFLNRKNKLEG